jgi:hypothetical protein
MSETVQSYSASSVFKHKATGTRNATAKWYIKKGQTVADFINDMGGVGSRKKQGALTKSLIC